jgi:small-conductance mechanosensitive channel
VKTKDDTRFKIKQIAVYVILLGCIFYQPVTASSTGLLHSVALSGGNRNHVDSLDNQSVPVYNQEVLPTDKSTLFSKKALINMQLFLENYSQLIYWRLSILNINKTRLFHDLKEAFRTLAGISGFLTVFDMLSMLFAVFAVSAVFGWLFWFFVLKKLRPRPPPSALSWGLKLWFGAVTALPEFLSILVFVVVSYLVYIFIYSNYFSIICPFYLTILIKIVVIWIGILFSKIIFSPGNGWIRLVPGDNETARVLHRMNVIFISVITSGVMSVGLLKYGGLKGDSLVIVKFLFGTAFILIVGMFFLFQRRIITAKLYDDSEADDSTWIHRQLAGSWLYLVEIYLFILWIIWSGKLLLSDSQFTLAFIASLLMIPIFLILDSIISWFFRCITSVIADRSDIEETEKGKDQNDNEPGILYKYLRSLSRLILSALLLLWLLHLWGIENTYTPLVVTAVKKIGFIFIIFVMLWRLIDRIISNMLAGSQKEPAGDEEESEGEWGGAPLLDRTQTLLPIVRKFLGIVMIVMLVLFTLSSLGVNIAPLLAGAGVMGIAIGFGAQKLVSDLLSGFFYLIDDAFRVGEYIEAGSTTGAVEKITLRNVMLRHHRGMLQIIPYGDLGAITNYMRGGIVVKFNLQFPYDTDVDKVRKIIKRVGIEMLADPELGKDFIKQIKSQGIREVGDSVLTIRVKFTANPGTHFVIRREAFRRISEALTNRGIHYAHRKVIVEVPAITNMQSGGEPDQLSDEVKQKIVAAAGAAAIEAQKKIEK